MIRWYAGLLVLAGACYPVQPREEIKPSRNHPPDHMLSVYALVGWERR